MKLTAAMAFAVFAVGCGSEEPILDEGTYDITAIVVSDSCGAAPSFTAAYKITETSDGWLMTNVSTGFTLDGSGGSSGIHFYVEDDYYENNCRFIESVAIDIAPDGDSFSGSLVWTIVARCDSSECVATYDIVGVKR